MKFNTLVAHSLSRKSSLSTELTNFKLLLLLCQFDIFSLSKIVSSKLIVQTP